MPKKSDREIAIGRIIKKLEDEKSVLDRKISNNKYEFRKLVAEQTVMKRERAEIDQLIRDLQKKKGSMDGKEKS